MAVTIKPQLARPRKIIVELDADKFERLAVNLGFFSHEFLRSLDLAERDYKSGRVRKIKSLQELRR